MTVQWTWEKDLGPEHIRNDLVRALRERIDVVLKEQESDHVARLQEFLRLPTVSGALDARGQADYRTAMDACLRLVQRHAERLGGTYRDHDGMACVVAWNGPRHGTDDDPGSIGIAAHLDVVPAGGEWTHPPFQGHVEDGTIWGRGAQDDKGPVAMAFAAIETLQRIGLHPAKDVRLLFGTMEETDDWPDMDLLLEREPAPDLTLVPDGAFPIIVGEKGILTVEWQGAWNEPDAGGERFIGLQSGERHNVVPGEARAWFVCDDPEESLPRIQGLPHVAEATHVEAAPSLAEGRPCIEARFEGRAAHGAFPKDGHNAALDALEAVAEATGGRGAGAFARFLLDHLADPDGAGLDLDERHERMGASTVNLGVVQMGPAHGHAQTNVRFPLGLTIDDVVARFDAATEDAPRELRIQTRTLGRPQDPIFVSPEDHPRMIRSLQAAYEIGTGREPRLASIAGTTYAKIFPLAVAFGPQDESSGEPILAHQPDERVTVERHLENIRVYALALALLACEEDDIKAAVAAKPD